jgi:hypothetical protein
VIDAHFAAPYERRWDASVELELERQIGLNWCWAAVAKGIVEHYGGPKRKQCQYATKFLQQRKTCCGTGRPPSRCDAPFDVDTVLAHHGMYAAPPFRCPVGLVALRKELERDRPVIALVRFPTSVHALVITAVDVAGRRIAFSDPWLDPRRTEMDADAFARAYETTGRWFYTILTRPHASAEPRSTISLLRDRIPRSESSPVPRRSSEPLDIDVYDADPYRLADGSGLQTAERVARGTFRLDVAGGDASLRLDRTLTAMSEDIEARLERGFEARIVRCFAYKFEALWFTDPSDTSHRTDHYIPVPPVPYYLEEGQEYGAPELRELLVEASRICVPAIEVDRRFIERLDQETAFQNGDR